MNDLYLIFVKLDLTPGCSIESVNERYRALASLFHPDQLLGGKRKTIAEQEMKLLNDRRDRLLKHLKSPAHQAQGDCECRRPVTTRFEARQAAEAKQATAAKKPSAAKQAAAAKQAPASAAGSKTEKSATSFSRPSTESSAGSKPSTGSRSTDQSAPSRSHRPPQESVFGSAGNTATQSQGDAGYSKYTQHSKTNQNRTTTSDTTSGARDKATSTTPQSKDQPMVSSFFGPSPSLIANRLPLTVVALVWAAGLVLMFLGDRAENSRNAARASKTVRSHINYSQPRWVPATEERPETTITFRQVGDDSIKVYQAPALLSPIKRRRGAISRGVSVAPTTSQPVNCL